MFRGVLKRKAHEGSTSSSESISKETLQVAAAVNAEVEEIVEEDYTPVDEERMEMCKAKVEEWLAKNSPYLEGEENCLSESDANWTSLMDSTSEEDSTSSETSTSDSETTNE